jgi:hypothetical protein
VAADQSTLEPIGQFHGLRALRTRNRLHLSDLRQFRRSGSSGWIRIRTSNPPVNRQT